MIGSGGLLRLGTPEFKWGIGMKADGFFKICRLLMSEIVDLQPGKSANPSSRCNSGCFTKRL